MLGISRYVQILLFLCIGSMVFCAIFVIFPNFLGKKINKEVVAKGTEHQKQVEDSLVIISEKRNFTREQIGKTSLLGRWLLSSEGSLPPPVINKRKEPYLILIWKHGKFLERRHIKRFTNKKFSPWKNCTVKHCVLSYQSKDLDVADAVVFHLHLTQSALDLPIRTQWNQRWIFLTDESPMHTFLGNNDYYNGVTIDSNEEFCTSEVFTHRLTASLQQWIQNKKRTIWFRVYLPHSEWVPLLVKEGFKFHHAKQEYVMLYRWLVTNEECNVPHYAHTNLGIGGFVYNEETKEVLVIKEKYASKTALWKLPGGYVEPGEDLEEAAKREVLEETGVQTTFKCIIGFRHIHDYAFNCSDIYMIAYLTPLNCSIKKCEREISDCRWMKINDYLEHSEVHENNKTVVKKMLEFLNHRMGIGVEHAIHTITNKPICIYSITKINNV